MKHINPEIGDQLAADYVLGTMPARTRQRFEAILKTNPQLRKVVATWEARLTPMTSSVPEVVPPRHVWNTIQKKLFGKRTQEPEVQQTWWSSLGFWRAATGFATIMLVISGLLVLTPAAEDPAAIPTIDPATDSMMVVIMEDMQTQSPAMTVSWESGATNLDNRVLRLRVIGHAEMAPDTAWELWMVPHDDSAPISLGLVTTHELQVLRVPQALAQPLDEAWGLGMSVEPKGGSPSGKPTGPMLYRGKCIMA